MSARRKVFKSNDYLNKKEVKELQEEHKKIFGRPVDKLG